MLAVLFEKDLPIVVPQSFVTFCLFFAFVYPESFMSLTLAIKKFTFWCLPLRRTPIVAPLNFGLIVRYIFYINLPILKILLV